MHTIDRVPTSSGSAKAIIKIFPELEGKLNGLAVRVPLLNASLTDFVFEANAGGRLTGAVLSGLVYQTQGLVGCLWWSAGFVAAAALLSLKLPEVSRDSSGGIGSSA